VIPALRSATSKPATVAAVAVVVMQHQHKASEASNVVTFFIYIFIIITEFSIATSFFIFKKNFYI
jgi:hypothetical protein